MGLSPHKTGAQYSQSNYTCQLLTLLTQMLFHLEKDLNIFVQISTKQRVSKNVYETTQVNHLMFTSNNLIYIEFAFTIY